MIRPSVGWDVDGYRSDLGRTRRGIFLKMGLDSNSLICPSGNQDIARVEPTGRANTRPMTGSGVTRRFIVGQRGDMA
jgi:hypothetical protein